MTAVETSQARSVAARTGQRLREWTSASRFWGGVLSVAVAAFLFSRIGIDAHLYRDDAIYAYGGQQLTHGVPPYVSIFDPKGPLSAFILGFATWLSHGLGVAELTMMRLSFFAICVLTGLAVYLLVLQLWNSVLGAVTAAVVFASFKGYAQDALRGPDAHTIGPLWAVLSMWFALRRQWYWAACMASLACLVKQTYVFYTLVVVLAALLYSPGRRRRAVALSVAGAATPLVLTFGYFAAKGALHKAWESAVLFPIVGLHRARTQTPLRNVRQIAHSLVTQYRFSGILFVVGMVALAAIAIAAVVRSETGRRAALLEPRLFIVGLTLLAQCLYLLRDYLSYDDLYQLLPYAAAGFGGAVALALTRRAQARRPLTIGVSAALAGLTAASCIWFVRAPFNDHELPQQRAAACALNRIIPAGSRLYAIGDPVPLVLTGRRNPDRYIYLYSGVAKWKVDHTRGGLHGWIRQVTSPRNAVIVFQSWNGGLSHVLLRAIRHAGYVGGYLGRWHVFLDAQARGGARAAGLQATAKPKPWPRTSSGGQFRLQNCGGG